MLHWVLGRLAQHHHFVCTPSAHLTFTSPTSSLNDMDLALPRTGKFQSTGGVKPCGEEQLMPRVATSA